MRGRASGIRQRTLAPNARLEKFDLKGKRELFLDQLSSALKLKALELPPDSDESRVNGYFEALKMPGASAPFLISSSNR